jgi:hypothetical protein
MKRSAILILGLACVAGLAVFACDDEVTQPEPVPGAFVVVLVSPNGEEGAVVLETTNAGIGGIDLVAVTRTGDSVEIEAAEGEAFHWREGGISRIVAYREAPGEIGLRLSVDDLNQLPALQIIEVAGGDDVLRSDLSGYEVEVVMRQPEAEAS